MIPHYPPFAYSIGTDIGAPAALGLLLEAVRAALQSPTAMLSLGNVAAAAEIFKYLLGAACVTSTRLTRPPRSELLSSWASS